jgi:hypothetical protein
MNGSVDDRSALGGLRRVVVARAGIVWRSRVGDRVDVERYGRRHLWRRRIIDGIRLRRSNRVSQDRWSGWDGCNRERAREHGRVFDFRHPGKDLFVQRRRGFLLAAFRHTGTLIGVLRIARRTTSLLDVFLDHGDNRVVGDAALTWTVIVENVAQTQPALLHSLLPDIPVVWLEN